MTTKTQRGPLEIAYSFFGIVFTACFLVSLVSVIAQVNFIPLDFVWTVWSISAIGMGSSTFLDADRMAAQARQGRSGLGFMSNTLGVRLFGLAFAVGGVLMMLNYSLAPWN